MLRHLSYILLILLVTLLSCSEKGSDSTTLTSGDQISYNFHIRPILSDNCFACHGPDENKRESGLRLDNEEGAYAALKENPGAHAIVPGKPSQSEVISRIETMEETEKMPPPESNLKLSPEEIDLIKSWVKQGAKYEPHWAFLPPIKASLPDVSDPVWVNNEIDHFVLAKLDRIGLKPNGKADKMLLLKRLSLDLTGLPPSEELMKSFEADASEKATEKIIDKLLDNPSFGERMAVLWMDISRYSDSYGYQDDNIRTQWPYRDWVIHAFNKNLPYDKFITWQLAGDLLPNPTKEQILATAFNRNHKYTEEGGVIPEEYRVEYILDKTNTFSKAIIGMTVECAQCHDHKYDPISQENYFEMYAFFNNTPEQGYEGDVSVSKPAKHPIMWVEKEDLEGVLDFVNHQDTSKIMVSVMEDYKDSLRRTFVLDRGIYDQPTTEVFPSTPKSILQFDESKYPKNRLGLAQWTFSEENPLTARVFVNLMWQEFFGAGIVRSAGDFGMQGKLPTHPELLDWLAVDFQESGWDVKHLVKKIVSAATYQQSASSDKKKMESDPDNFYLASYPRIRLNAEHIRDMVLASSGLLSKEIGGPSVKPYQPEGLWEAATSGRGELAEYRQDKGDKLYRRGLYTFIKLTSPPPKPIIFDGSNRDVCEVTRNRTNTPLQALAMLNDPLVLEASRVLANKLIGEGKENEEAIQEAFLRIICRTPKAEEFELLKEYYQEELKRFKQKPETILETVNAGEFPLDQYSDSPETAALMQVVVAIYNVEEAITKT
ncbi:PSD1 and planctomycete cytochrome C domain-containing protein [Cyclobacterium sp. 1_MG-2023]|uniref:PSD1 and planctomycete cytochrome C domain-containing protein n=2 Tax=Cyclobacterium TaxID=68288 RepID=UPI0026E1FFA1|nr:PSD1 and planctomycete cytochrome C domain-containing protein [Cyclobacterium sp. 1_MG-2023]MDO6437596.1 PSD1 and planctomycete cytochrome C domain-containing protein [Cyclobacterium sp. 1_MG-2023]